LLRLLRCRRKFWIEQDANEGNAWHELAQQTNTFGFHLRGQQRVAGQVRAGPVEAIDQARLDRIAANSKDDRNRRSRPLRRLG